MEFKKVVRNNRVCKTIKPKVSTISNVEVITENVFVPVTKTIFTKKRAEPQCNFSKRKIELVKPTEYDNSETISLLKKPLCLPVKSHMTSIANSKEINEINNAEALKKSKRLLNLINRSYVFTNEQSKNFPRQLQNKKKQVSLFPSPISNLPLNSLAKCQPLPIDKDITKSSKGNETDKSSEKAIIGDIDHTSRKQKDRFGKASGNNKKLKSNKTEGIMCLLQTDFKQIRNDVSSNSITSSNVSNIPLVLSRTATTTTASIKKGNARKQRSYAPYFDSGLKNANAAVKRTISSDVDYEEEIKFPIRHIESNTFNQIRCTPFDFTTSDNFLETREVDTLKDMYSKILTSHNFQHSQDDVDHSILSFLKKSPFLYQDDICFHKSEPLNPCRIKYSWQVIGTSSQTSQTLLDSLVKEDSHFEDESIRKCSVKYSWQIIGIATQTSRRDFTASECHSVISFLSTKPNSIRRNIRKTENDAQITTVWRNGKRFIVLNNQYTQTFAHKENQTIFTELYKEHHK